MKVKMIDVRIPPDEQKGKIYKNAHFNMSATRVSMSGARFGGVRSGVIKQMSEGYADHHLRITVMVQSPGFGRSTYREEVWYVTFNDLS